MNLLRKSLGIIFVPTVPPEIQVQLGSMCYSKTWFANASVRQPGHHGVYAPSVIHASFRFEYPPLVFW